MCDIRAALRVVSEDAPGQSTHVGRVGERGEEIAQARASVLGYSGNWKLQKKRERDDQFTT